VRAAGWQRKDSNVPEVAVNGIPTDLSLTVFKGAELVQLCIGLHQLQFHFHPTGSISVEGGWELRDAAGVLIDTRHVGPNRPPYELRIGAKTAFA